MGMQNCATGSKKLDHVSRGRGLPSFESTGRCTALGKKSSKFNGFRRVVVGPPASFQTAASFWRGGILTHWGLHKVINGVFHFLEIFWIIY